MRLFVLGCVVAGGCGRLGFGPSTDDAHPSGPCDVAAKIPDLITLRGETFNYTDFLNNTTPLPDVFVRATDVLTPTTTSGVLSDSGTGNYALTISANQMPRAQLITYELAGNWITRLFNDRPYDRDVAGLNMMQWHVGDGPMWSSGSMASIYSTLGATIDPAKAVLSVSVRDCSEAIVEGVTFELDPSPSVGGYLGANGLPGAAAATLAPYTQYIAFNVEPVPTRIRGIKAGVEFIDFVVDVMAGDNVNYALVHAVE